MTIAVVVAVEDIVVATKRRLELMDYVHCDELPQEIIRQVLLPQKGGYKIAVVQWVPGVDRSLHLGYSVPFFD